MFQNFTKNLSIEKLNQQKKTTPKQSTEVFQGRAKVIGTLPLVFTILW